MDDLFMNDLVNDAALAGDFDMMLPTIDAALLGVDGDGDDVGQAGFGSDGLASPPPLASSSSSSSSSTTKAELGPGDWEEDLDDGLLELEDSNSDDASAKDASANDASAKAKGPGGAAAKGKGKKGRDGGKAAEPPPRGQKSGISTKGARNDAEKKTKRRKQIAAASRSSRARRKKELEELREENGKLRDERSQFLHKIGELQVKVETMRESGSTDMRVENALLRAQLEEHKRFVSCFKHLCDGAPTSLGARQAIYKQGSDSAQAHVLGLISQSVADHWVPGIIPEDANIPYQNFRFCYKFKAEYGDTSADPRRRLNVRVDLSFPGFQADSVSDFLWNSMSNTNVQQRLYRVDNIELTQLADDMPDKDTKMVYFREKVGAPKKDQDWVVMCKRARRDLADSTLNPPADGTGASAGVAPASAAAALAEAASRAGFFSSFFGGSSASASADTNADADADASAGASAAGAVEEAGAFSSACASASASASDAKPLPAAKRMKRAQSSAVSKVPVTVLAMSTTQHSAAPQFDNANRITSMFVHGATTWDSGSDARVVIVFSFPEDFKIKAMGCLDDVVKPDGTMGLKFAEVIKEFNEMLGEQGGSDGLVL